MHDKIELSDNSHVLMNLRRVPQLFQPVLVEQYPCRLKTTTQIMKMIIFIGFLMTININIYCIQLIVADIFEALFLLYIIPQYIVSGSIIIISRLYRFLYVGWIRYSRYQLFHGH